MTPPRSTGGTRSWRPADLQAEQARLGEAPWRRGASPTAPGERGRSTLPGKVAVVFTGILAFSAAVVYVALWLAPPPPATLVPVVAGYEANLAVPHNVYGRAGVEALAEFTRSIQGGGLFKQRGQLKLGNDPLEFTSDGKWDGALDSLPRTAFVVFGLHGAADASGPYLLPNDADANGDPRGKLPIAAILERMKRLPSGTQKVLVFDAAGPSALPVLGVLHNDFARALRGLDGAIREIPNLVVIASADNDQRSWPSEDWRRTAFNLYLTEGLKGGADSNRDSRVNLLELFTYLEREVPRWVAGNRDAVQTPILLPSGEEGQKRAQRTHLCMADPGWQRPDPRNQPKFELPPELASAWDTCKRIGETKPEPAIVAPALWHQYQATLVRHEQLLRAGDSANAARLTEKLRDIEQGIDKARKLELASARNTLAMPAALGVQPDLAWVGKSFEELWNIQAADAQAGRWDDIKAGMKGDPLARLANRLKLVDLALEKAIDNPAANWERAARLAKLLEDDVNRPCAEGQLLAMIHRDLPQPTPTGGLGDLVTQALATRRQAEQSVTDRTPDGGHAYWEHTLAWTREAFEPADADRRLGQDRLFASEPDEWTRGLALLRQASTRYGAVRAKAEEARLALSVRDHALAILPYYSCWLSKLPRSSDPLKGREEEQFVRSVEELWGQVHKLASDLEAAQLRPAGTPAVSGALTELTQAVSARLKELDQRFIDSARERGDLDVLSTYRDADDVLCVPFADPALRLRIAVGERRVTRRLFENTTTLGATRTFGNELPKQQERAARLGRLTLAAMGKPWFTSTEVGERETFDRVLHRLDNFAVEEKWWESLRNAGGQLGVRRVLLTEKMTALAKAARDTDPRTDLPLVRKSRFEADRLGRLLDGSQVGLLTESAADNLRKMLVSEWLVHQAKRTLDDGFFAEQPDAVPYYRVAGTLYLDDARRLTGKLRAPTALLAAQDALNAPAGLTFDAPSALALTSEQKFGIDYRVLPAAGSAVRAGVPVLWVEMETPLQSIAPMAGTRFPRELSPDRPAEVVPVQVSTAGRDSDHANKQVATIRVRGLFRGQQFDRRTPVELHPAPDLARVFYPGPTKSSVAVRADREVQERFASGAGSVAIVLDCSGSMGEESGTAYGPDTKFVQATGALRKLLGKLPAGTQLSLWVFGQREPDAERKEDADRTVKPIVQRMTWEPALLESFMQRIDYPALTPWNETPLMRSMILAKKDLVEATGFKTLLVLTDGDDNRFEFDRELNPRKQSIPEKLREEFANSGIVVQIVGFRFPGDSETKAIAQFRGVENLPLPGKFQTVREANELAIALEKAVRQRVRYWVDGETNERVAGVRDDGLDVSPLTGSLQWFPGGVDPGPYKLRAVTDTRTLQSVLLQPGEPLLTNLVRTPRGSYFQRAFVLREEYGNKPYAEAKDWRLAALQNQRLAGKGAQFLIGLERDPGTVQVTTLAQDRPRETWFSIAAPGADKAKLRIAQAQGYPFAAWSVDAAQWPDRSPGQPARPQVSAWWSPATEFPPADSIECGPGLESLLGIARRTLQIDGERGIVESVGVEQHTVEVAPGQFEPKPCLAVRVRPPLGKPVFLRTRGLSPAGQEHRYYFDANKYTALFWPVSAETVNEARVTLQFVSVDAFQKDAKQRGFSATLPLSEPLPTDVRPGAVELK